MCVCVCTRACMRARMLHFVTILQAEFEPEIPVLRHKKLCLSYTVWLL
jgi:hypothetical protein